MRLFFVDALRALAILLVFAFHYPQNVFGSVGRFGWLGVDLFFVLSGYLVGYPLFRALDRTGELSLKTFFSKRFFRTLPAYYFVLLLYLAIPQFREHFEMPEAWRFLLFVQNFNLDRRAFSHAWSLCVEVQFYLALPFLALLLNKKRWAAPVALVCLAAFGLMLRGWIWMSISPGGGHAPDWQIYLKAIYYPTWTRLDGLLVGLSVALLQLRLPNLWLRFANRKSWTAMAGLFSLTLAIVLFLNRRSLEATVFGYPLAALGFGFWLTSAIHLSHAWQSARLTAGISRLALVSYSFYLVHKQMIHLVRGTSQEWLAPNSYGEAAVALIVSYLAAEVMYRLIEMPFLRLRDRYLSLGSRKESTALTTP